MWSWHQTEPYQRDDPVSQDQLNDPAIAPVVKGIYLVNAYMKQILGLAVKVAKSQATVLIQGESGTGKEVMAKIIQRQPRSGRSLYQRLTARPFGQPAGARFFGYVGVALLQAPGKRKGKESLRMAQGGTIFPERIGDMDINMQVRISASCRKRSGVNRRFKDPSPG